MNEEMYVISEAACMQLAMEDFGITVSFKMAEAIKDDFMKMMINAGHIFVGSDKENEK